MRSEFWGFIGATYRTAVVSTLLLKLVEMQTWKGDIDATIASHPNDTRLCRPDILPVARPTKLSFLFIFQASGHLYAASAVAVSLVASTCLITALVTLAPKHTCATSVELGFPGRHHSKSTSDCTPAKRRTHATHADECSRRQATCSSTFAAATLATSRLLARSVEIALRGTRIACCTSEGTTPSNGRSLATRAAADSSPSNR